MMDLTMFRNYLKWRQQYSMHHEIPDSVPAGGIGQTGFIQEINASSVPKVDED